MKSERNYSVEFMRFLFAINFAAIHVFISFTKSFPGEKPTYRWALDTILPFMIFSGYFLMQGFQRQKEHSLANHIDAGRQAWHYLKSRLISLMPIFLAGQFMGFVAVNLWFKTPVTSWPIGLLNHIGEFAGLQLTGFGYGSAFVGAWGDAPAAVQLLNGPMWFISGIFICGYLIYFLLAKCEKTYLYFIVPLFSLLFYGSVYLNDTNPIWQNVFHFGDFSMVQGFPHMFIGLSLGCLIYVAVQNLKDKEWSGGMRTWMTIVSILLWALVIIKTWVPTTVPFMKYIDISWGNVHLLTVFFAFFVLLNADGVTHLLNRKIWKVPGRMSLYFYILHYPVIILIAMFIGTQNNFILYAATVAVTLVLSYLAMKLDSKMIQPWLKSKPWYSKEQKELEKAAEGIKQ